MTPENAISGTGIVIGAIACLAGVAALGRLGVIRNPLRDVPVWAFVAGPCVLLLWLGVPWWLWPLPLLGVYALHVRLWPYAPCRWCGGAPKRGAAGAGTRSIRLCRHCGGKGLRVRWSILRGDSW